ncbi:M28 family peptidase [Clostridium sp. CM027]|uniref:M28 family peptidase n=1 Tax=Clostridium sp. CM027 TaxID=2849865 RepID=UPI00215A77BB|nr:M28 family peptidase [Clostridium sp. CM027]
MKPILKLSVILAMVLTFSSCSSPEVSQNSKTTTGNHGQSVQVSQVQTPVKIPTIKETVATLCSDEFQGRLTGSKGNEKTGEYIVKTFKDIGLDPFFDDSYYQKYYLGVNSSYRGGENNIKLKMVNNVVGVIKGKKSENAVVISAHFDHLGYVDGTIIRGALDNASGVSALIEVAHKLKEKSKAKPFDTDIIFCAFNGEEVGLKGSQAFVNAVTSTNYNFYNINIDCVGAKKGGKLALKNKNELSNKLYGAVKTAFKKDNIGFADTVVHGLSDHVNFQSMGIPSVFIAQENVENLVHKPTDTPDTLDYGQIDKIANAISDFIGANDGVIFIQ